MGFLKAAPTQEGPPKPVHLTLSKDRIRSVKRGHPWIFREALVDLPSAQPGALALLKDKTGDILAKGYYEPACTISFRSFVVGRERLDDALLGQRLARALALRRRLFPDPEVTNGFRLVNEGDGLPGLVIDIYGHVAVIKLDGPGAGGFYEVQGISDWLMASVLPKGEQMGRHPAASSSSGRSGDSEGRGKLVAGELPKKPVLLLENGARYHVDIVQGQKTGFFLDQRDSRALIGRLVPQGGRVLNLFGYTGGFSVYAGRGGAGHVTTVDVAVPAIAAACRNWELNGLDAKKHDGRAEDAFTVLEEAVKARQRWDLVVADPPSFAPNKQSVEKAKLSYGRLFALAAQCTSPGGLLALSSCSSHFPAAMFNEVCEEAVAGTARRNGRVLAMLGQPPDHPFPLACEELRYLKFNLYQLDN